MAFQDTKLKPDEFAVGTSLCLTLGETQVGFFNTSQGIYAINNVCPHRGAPLHDGFVNDAVVTCPWHQWNFQLWDGKCQNIPGARTPSYPLELREGTIWINLD